MHVVIIPKLVQMETDILFKFLYSSLKQNRMTFYSGKEIEIFPCLCHLIIPSKIPFTELPPTVTGRIQVIKKVRTVQSL